MENKPEFDLLTQFKKELDESRKTIKIVENIDKGDNLRYLTSTGGYDYNQVKVINSLKMMHNSMFETGHFDSDGQRKLFLNITQFAVDVFTKNTDVDVKDFKLIPNHYDASKRYEAFLFQRYFSIFVKDNGFSSIINDLNEDFGAFGTCVAKKQKEGIIRVSVEELVNTQTCETLQKGVEQGGFVMQRHKMNHYTMSQYPDWKKVPYFEGEKLVYERYAMTPRSSVDKYQGSGNGKETRDDFVLAMAIICPGNARKGEADEVLFIEEVDEIPFIEAHSKKVKGRWLGIGQVEKLFENQIARNLTANLRRKALLWGSKKIFQSKTDGVQKNLAKDVMDGQVLNVGMNGDIVAIDTTTKSLADYNSDEAIWTENTQQRTFTFEVASGEGMPSGTPFRLGAMLSNSAMSYFERQREIFGLFLRELFYAKIIPIFKVKAKDYLHIISRSEEGSDVIYQAYKECIKNQYYTDLALSPNYMQMEIMGEEELDQYIQKEMNKAPSIYIQTDKDLYKYAKYDLELDITGESINFNTDMETLTTLHQTLMQAGDMERANKVLDKILLAQGKDMRSIIGKAPMQNPAQQGPVNMQNQTQPAQQSQLAPTM
jgi:hypothetical protein